LVFIIIPSFKIYKIPTIYLSFTKFTPSLSENQFYFNTPIFILLQLKIHPTTYGFGWMDDKESNPNTFYQIKSNSQY